MASDNALVETPPAKPRFRLSFGLGHLLTLMAGLGVGMAIMQPWKTWERPPAPVDYEVAVVSVPADKGPTKGGDAAIHLQLLKWYGPTPTTQSTDDAIGKLLGTSSLSTIEGEAGVMEVTLPLPAGTKAAPDKFKIQVKPYSVRGSIRTGVISEFSWIPELTAPTEQVVTQKTGEAGVYELTINPSPKDAERERIFIVLTPQDATKRQFTITPAAANANPTGKK